MVATLGDKLRQSPRFCRKKLNSLNFSRFLRFFSCSHHLSDGGYTCDFRLALATRQFSKKWHHHGKYKIARVAADEEGVYMHNSVRNLCRNGVALQALEKRCLCVTSLLSPSLYHMYKKHNQISIPTMRCCSHTLISNQRMRRF